MGVSEGEVRGEVMSHDEIPRPEPTPDDEEEIEYVVNDAPELMHLIDWIFYAGNPVMAPEPETEEEEAESQ